MSVVGVGFPGKRLEGHVWGHILWRVGGVDVLVGADLGHVRFDTGSAGELDEEGRGGCAFGNVGGASPFLG